MPIYWSIFLWVFFLGLTQPIEHNPLLNNRATECKASWKLAFALMFPVTFFAAVRGPICDTPTYVGIFEAMPERIDVFSEWIGTWKDSQLFYGLTHFVRNPIRH